MIAVGLKTEIEQIGRRLLREVETERRSVLGRERWEEALMLRLMENADFKVRALRFVDVLPALSQDADLVRHLDEYFGEEELPLPGVARWGAGVGHPPAPRPSDAPDSHPGWPSPPPGGRSENAE